MFDVTDILARLQNGETPEALAKEFTHALNEAETAQKAKSKELEKLVDFQAVCDAMIKFFSKWYPEFKFEDMELDTEKMLQEVTGMLDLMRGLVTATDKPKFEVKMKRNTDEGVPKKNSDEVLVSFLRDMGLM